MPDDLVLVLTNRRSELGMSLAAVAQAAGVGVTTVHSWERRTKCPSVDHASAWAEALGFRLELRRRG